MVIRLFIIQLFSYILRDTVAPTHAIDSFHLLLVKIDWNIMILAYAFTVDRHSYWFLIFLPSRILLSSLTHFLIKILW